MPFLFSKAFGSIDGYRTYHQKVYTTYTFPGGTSTFTTPHNVNNLVTVTGKGQDGVSDYGDNISYPFSILGTSGGSGPNPPYANYSTTWGRVQEIYNYAAPYIGGTTPSSGITAGLSEILVEPDNSYTDIFVEFSPFYYLANRSQFNVTYNYWYGPTPTSGNVTWHDVVYNGQEGWGMVWSWVDSGGSGASTTGFGYTFSGGGYSGGTGYPATPATYNNVAVTPNTTYTVTNNGSLTIAYYT
jgi:hypothetical protein